MEQHATAMIVALVAAQSDAMDYAAEQSLQTQQDMEQRATAMHAALAAAQFNAMALAAEQFQQAAIIMLNISPKACQQI